MDLQAENRQTNQKQCLILKYFILIELLKH